MEEDDDGHDDDDDLYSKKEHNLISLFVSIILVNNLFSILIYVASLY